MPFSTVSLWQLFPSLTPSTEGILFLINNWNSMPICQLLVCVFFLRKEKPFTGKRGERPPQGPMARKAVQMYVGPRNIPFPIQAAAKPSLLQCFQKDCRKADMRMTTRKLGRRRGQRVHERTVVVSGNTGWGDYFPLASKPGQSPSMGPTTDGPIFQFFAF